MNVQYKKKSLDTGYFVSMEPTIYDLELGEPFSTKCIAPKTDPESKVFWLLKSETSKSGPQFTTVNSSHVSVDDKVLNCYFKIIVANDNKQLCEASNQ